KHLKLHGMASEKFVWIPNGIELEEWDRESPALPPAFGLIAELKAKGRFILGYAGGHGPSNALDLLIDAAGSVRHLPLDVVLVGRGQSREALQQLAAARGASNLHFLPEVPKLAMPAVLRQFDAAYLGHVPSALFQFGISPNKLMDYMAASLPIIQ